ncbi:hypothetical protein MLD38_039124 [Melastoma candidum]|uniref:Uncharacterized protein n=1 Tax=Melastoma candidum TaxID=119954 RepID=A0ACB9L135_9MYRT|nr:hypothetical protein MLD38_039124 [Melastoma candidum]
MMFRRNDKNKIRANFKLQFHATLVPMFNGEKLMVSVVPSDVGKPIVRLEKSVVKDGKCRWENTVHETVNFGRESKSGRFTESIYQFIVSQGSGKGGLVGEVSVDLADYAERNPTETTKGISVALPLKNSSSDAILHVFIQRLLEDGEREAQEKKDLKDKSPNKSLRSHFSNGSKAETDRSIESSLVKAVANIEENGSCGESSGSEVTVSISESSSEISTPWENGVSNGITRRDHNKPFFSSMSHQSLLNNRSEHEFMPAFEEDNGEVRWGSFSSLGRESAIDLQEANVKMGLEKNVDSEIESLKAEIAAMTRQADLSDLELQTLRKQIVKECKKSQDLSREIISLKDERDVLDAECSNLRAAFRDRFLETRPKNSMQLDGGEGIRGLLTEVRQELNFEKSINADLRIQLQKTLESNAELILAVKDLEEMLTVQGNQEVCTHCNQLALSENVERSILCLSRSETDDDEEQKALEELVKEHRDTKEAYLLEQKILDLNSEIEIYRRDRDEMEMQMEQLELDYEILKQKSNEMSVKLEQSQLQEQLKLQYEASPAANINELRVKIESLENELSCRSKECSDSVSTIRELESRIGSLEEELEKKGEEFVADLEIVTRARAEQEKRAIRAEETLKKLMRKNADTADRLQEELQRLLDQMASTIDANEKLAIRSMAEVDELRTQKGQLEEMLQKSKEKLDAVRSAYEAKVGELSQAIKVRTGRMEQMGLELGEKAKMLKDYEKNEKEASGKFMESIQSLKSEILTLSQEKTLLLERVERTECASKEAELSLQGPIEEKAELENAISLMQKRLEDLQAELKYTKDSKDESDRVITRLKLDVRTARVELNDTKNSLIQSGVEKEHMQNQVIQLRGELNRKNEEIKDVEKALKRHNGPRSADANGGKCSKMKSNNKVLPDSRDDDEIASLRAKLQLLQGEIKLKDAALEDSTGLLSDKEKGFTKRIKELETKLVADHVWQQEEKNKSVELDSILEKNKSMEAELKELQEKYSEMSLKFAEVEGLMLGDEMPFMSLTIHRDLLIFSCSIYLPESCEYTSVFYEYLLEQQRHLSDEVMFALGRRPFSWAATTAAAWKPPVKKSPVVPPVLFVLLLVLVFALVSSLRINSHVVLAPKLTDRSTGVVSVDSNMKHEFPLRCGNQTQVCPRDYYPTEMVIDRIDNEGRVCPDYFRWIHEDLRPWKSTGIARDMVEQARPTAHFRLVIVNGRPYVEKFRKSIQTRDLFTIWGVLQLLRRGRIGRAHHRLCSDTAEIGGLLT